MKNKLLLTVMVVFMCFLTRAQVSGTYTIPGAQFPTITSAITALNSFGVGNGGVIFNITAGYTETFVSKNNGILTTVTSTAAKPIIFQKSGTGPNPLVIAGKGTSTGTPMDAVFALGGTDYVTFDGINIMDNPTNTTSTTKMETGFWLAKASAKDGTQHITIRNCKLYGFSKNYLIASTAQVLSGTATNATSFAGTNSYIRIYSDSLVNVTTGAQQIYFSGSGNASTTGLYDYGNEIGVTRGNVILNSIYVYTMYTQWLRVAGNLFTSLGGQQINCGQISANATKSLQIYNNDIGNFTVTPSTAITVINDASNLDTVNVYNNNIHDISSSAVTSQSFIGISEGSAGLINKIYGNQVTNITWGTATTTTGTFTGIILTSTAAPTGAECHVYNNLLSGNVITNTNTGNVNSFIFCNWYGTTAKIYNNTITNNTTNCKGTTNLLNGNCLSSNEWAKYIYGNTISNHTNTDGTVNAIYHALSLRTYIFQNKISRITSTGNAAIINGITFDGGSFGQVYNNYISELYTPASSGTRQVTALNILQGSSVAVHYNTIYLDAASTGTNFGTAGIYAATSCVLLLRNNIVDNVSVPSGTGNTVALYYGGTSRANYDIGSDNNDLFAGAPGVKRLIYYDGTNLDQSLTAYQVRAYPADQMSVSENTPFMNVASAPYNLHINTAVTTQCESAGTIIATPDSIKADYYLTPRYPNTGYPFNPSYPPLKPDIGAEEFGGIYAIVSPPQITLTPLSNTSSLTSRTLTASITSLTGIPTSGTGLPVLYWNINNGTWNAATGSSLGGGQYSFSFGSGVSLQDSIKYYLVAQDMNVSPGPNVGSTPPGASGFTINPPMATTPPPKPFAYKVVTPACGNYNVGSGGDYPTLTAAMNDLNTREITCPVTLLLTDALYVNETLPVAISNIAGLSPVNKLTIKPAPGNNASIQGTNAVSIITFNGANYVTIDGSNDGTNSRNLTIWNSNSSGGEVILFTSPGDYTKSSSNDVIKNCNIRGSSQVTNVTYGILCNATTGGGYKNLVIDNNFVYSANIGIRINGTVPYPALNCQVTNNLVGTAVDSTSIQLYGIYTVYSDNTLIQGNEVIGASQNGVANNNISGIRAYTLATNTKIRKNKVHGFHLNGGSAYVGPWGIFYRAEANSTTEISNNVVYDIQGIGGSSAYYAVAGISLQSGGNIRVWDNTIDLEGACLNPATTSQSADIVVSPGVTSVDIRNNIMKNNLQTSGGSGANVFTYGLFCQAPPSVFTNLSNNDYYVIGFQPSIGYINGTNYSSLTSWQSATGKDQNSLVVNPAFTSLTDLHTVVPALNNAGVKLLGITTDFSGVLRTDPPDMGAFEFNLPITAITTLSASNANYTSADLHGNINTNGEKVNVSFEYGLTTTYGNTTPALPASVRSFTPVSYAKTVTGLIANQEYHYRAKGVSATSAQVVYGDDVTFTLLELPTLQGPANVCQGSVSNVYTTEPDKSDYLWTVSAGGTITGGGTLTDNTVTVTWNTAGSQTVTVNFRNKAGGPYTPVPAVYPVTVNPLLPVSVSITASANQICLNTEVTFTATPVNGGTNPSYQWMVDGSVDGTNSPVFSFIPVNGQVVTCILSSNEVCNSGSPATSNAITMSVNSLQPVDVTIAASVNPICMGSSITFTATPVNGGDSPSYQWKVGNANAGTNSPVFTLDQAWGGELVKCIMTSNMQCTQGNPATSNIITVYSNFPDQVNVTIAASANPACSGDPVTFTATPENGGTTPSYQWKVNGTVVGTDNPAYTYNPGNNDVITCVLTSSLQCTSGNPATSNAVTMTVNPILTVGVTITASENPVTEGTTVTFNATPENGGTTPAYQWKVNGIDAGTNSSGFSYVPVNNDAVSCVLTSNETCTTGNPATSNTINMTVKTTVPDNTKATGTVSAGENFCYNATQIITVAGGSDTFIVHDGGSATMIAGLSIDYLPGTTVEPGGYMLGRITTTSEYCGTKAQPITAALTGTGENQVIPSVQSLFKVYPNPTTGIFTLEVSDEIKAEKSSVEIYGIRGERVLTEMITGQNKHEFSLVGKPIGLYYIRVISGEKIGSGKIIKQ